MTVKRGRIMKDLTNEKGIALVLTLVLVACTLAFSSSLIYMVVVSTKSPTRGYKTCLDAARGTVALMTEVIDSGGNDPTLTLSFTNQTCTKQQKIPFKTADWDTVTDCPGDIGDVYTMKGPDVYFTINGLVNDYNMTGKIVDTIWGNTAPSDNPGGAGTGARISGLAVVEGGFGSGHVTIGAIHSMYRVEVTCENVNNTNETAWLSFLYAH